ncbi:thioredoxin family protein [Reichenbachiella agarivorans]|uniref:Thioredoxin family protein n=1 Tax=Reichenbachiella agarivorans TaxID=2979464 RepID=A0ABY6CNU0_9BACT|nr:thioredoxin family protein [Reichenbachiella agarivorans]UXP31018.1 thioredoxin family protein [Reichenbachiella agarivorans]
MTKEETIQAAVATAYTFEEYITLIEQLHTEEKATSFPDNKSYYDYSVLGLSRMKRVYKKVELNSEIIDRIKAISSPQHWVLISESWCGDASQTVPVIAKIAEQNPNITLHIVLRDSNPELMAYYKTNGATSIPILVILNENWSEITVWGPRPAVAQQKVMEYKAMPEAERPAYEVLSTEIQKWYNADKGLSTQNEIAMRLI